MIPGFCTYLNPAKGERKFAEICFIIYGLMEGNEEDMRLELNGFGERQPNSRRVANGFGQGNQLGNYVQLKHVRLTMPCQYRNIIELMKMFSQFLLL